MSTINAVFFTSSMPSPHSLNSLDSAKGFAGDIVKRMQFPQGESAQLSESGDIQTDVQQKTSSLQSSLETTINYLSATHGKSAATAAMGLIYKRLGEGEVTEESLGNALLDVTRFIDTNFGFEQGDEFIKHLNSDLNNSINELFNNGKDEVFMAVTTVNGKPSATVTQMHGNHSSIIIEGAVADTVKDGLAGLEEITNAIIKTIADHRHQLGQEASLNAYTPHADPLPTGAMVDLQL